MDRAQKEGKPFYVNLWPDDVHSPYWPPVGSWGEGGKRALYLAVLEEMDRQFGRLFDYVRDNEKLLTLRIVTTNLSNELICETRFRKNSTSC